MSAERRPLLLAAALAAVLAAVPAFADDFVLSVLAVVFRTAFVGIAWNLMMGYAGQLSLGHALYFGTGAYLVGVLAIRHGVSPWLGMAAAFAVPAALGTAIGALGYRFAVRGVYFALLTIAFAEFARIVFEHWEYVGKAGGLYFPALAAGNLPLESLRGGARFFYYALLVLMLAGWGLAAVLVASPLGYRWRAVREDEDAARAIGVPALRVKLAAVALSGGLTGIAGGWFGLMSGSLFPDSVLGMQVSIEMIVAPILGGLGTLFGPILGAAIAVPLGELSRDLSQQFHLNGLNLLIYGALLMAMVWIAPQGCWPWLAARLGLGRRRPDVPLERGRPAVGTGAP